MSAEEWKDVKGFEGLYQISNLGRVKSLDKLVVQKTGQRYWVKGQILKPYQDGCGYLMVNLAHKGKKSMRKVHRMVAEKFCSNPDNKPCVNHIDSNNKNNRYDNLEWCTNLENIKHYWRSPLKISYGEGNANSKLKTEEVLEIRRTYIKGDSIFGSKPLARKFGVSDMTIRNILNNKKWRHTNEIISDDSRKSVRQGKTSLLQRSRHHTNENSQL